MNEIATGATDGERPWTELGKLTDVVLAFADLPSGKGWWDPGERVILLDRRLGQRERRCSLAHELEHALAGDEDLSGVSLVWAMRQEARASSRAARRLIPITRLVDALLWSRDEHELAEELHVDLDTLRCRLATLTELEHQIIDRELWAAEEVIA